MLWKKKGAEFGDIRHRCSLQRSKTTNRPCFLVSCGWEWPSGQRTVLLHHPVVKGLAPTTDSRSAFQRPKQMQILQPSNTSWERQEQEREGAEGNQAVASDLIDDNGRWRDLDPWIPPWEFLIRWEGRNASQPARTTVLSVRDGSAGWIRRANSSGHTTHARVNTWFTFSEQPPSTLAFPSQIHGIHQPNSAGSDGSTRGVTPHGTGRIRLYGPSARQR